MNSPDGNLANGAVWYTIVFKVSAFTFFIQKLEIETVCFENLKLNPNNHYGFRDTFECTLYNHSVCSIYCTQRALYTLVSIGDIIGTIKIKGLWYFYNLVWKQTLLEVELLLHKKYIVFDKNKKIKIEFLCLYNYLNK